MSKYKVISADSHVVEPGDLWTNYTAKEFRERAPKLVREKDGSDTFMIEGKPLVRPAAFSVAGREAALGTAMTFEDVYKGGYDPDARLKDMARDGVEAEVVYPSVTMRIFAIQDLPLKQACFEAYNAWATDFSGAHPDRLKALAVMTLEDVEGAVGELHRAKKTGLVGAMVSISSDDPNLYTQTKYDPFWATAQDLDMPVSLHVLTDQKALVSNLSEHAVSATTAQRTLANMIFGGVFQRFPRLKVISAENDVGWAAYFVEKIDYLFRKRVKWASESPISGKGMKPSEYFHRNIWLTFMEDKAGVFVRNLVGVDHMMWSSDYPHNDSTWPHSQKVINWMFEGVPDTDRNKILAGNAASLYGLP